MRPWDPGSFVQEEDEDDLPTGWGEGTPPDTPPPQQRKSLDSGESAGSGDLPGVEGVGSAPSTAPNSARGAGNNDTQLAVPWGSGVSRGAARRELPSLFTNVPDQASATSGVDPKGRPPRPPAPESRMPWSINDGAADQRAKRGRRPSRERPELVAALAAAEKPSAADGVRQALHLLRQQKKWVTPEETLEGLQALQRMQRHLRAPAELK